jgi:cellulose synthase/poly-beta-1,6-N-acetylglucosamine synthase-like glycosyltransferase
LLIISSLLYALWFLTVIIYTVIIALLLLTPARHPTQSGDGFYPTVSLVVPTYNEAQIIGRKLENILQLDYPKEKLDVLVVDSASSDDTGDIVRRFASTNAGSMHVRLIEQSVRQGKSSAINEAQLNSNSDIFALTDADVVVQPQSLKNLIRQLGEDGIGAASGVEVPVGGVSTLSNIETGYRVVYTAVRMAEASLDTPFMCESEFSVFKRRSLEPLRPGCMCDDLELTAMMRSKGVKAVYAIDAPFFEQEATSLRSKLLHKYRRGMANQHGIIRNRGALFNRKYGKYGTIVFPFEFFVHILSPLLLFTMLGLFLGTLFLSPPTAAVQAIIMVLSGVPAILLLRQLSLKYPSAEISKSQNRLSWLLGTLSFLAFQIVLAASLVQLAVRGPELKWSQISETRTPIRTEIKVESR